MPAPESVLQLVERFERQRDALRSPAYNETSLRREFLDPLFRALGWDVDNSQGHAEKYKDVVHEDAIKIGTANKAPDYSFRIGGARKFFVEAKRPLVNIKSDSEPAYQLRRYAWSAKLPLSILTDFEELAVYDCRARPAPGDRASAHRTLIFHYTEYASRWDELAGIFSRDAVLKGSFDQYAESKKGRRGTTTVDSEFLKEIEGWRDALARNLALRNRSIEVRDLNFAVQRIIDRIIFLRIAEDRGLEEYGRLLALTNGANTYQRLSELFVQADARYNSGLFHFRKERERPEAPDDLTLTLVVDDKVIKDILKSLYYPESPYEFSVISADILGQVYEQFLGKVIRLTASHQARVEEKPEVRKAGGVYYTPTYIVDYIVQETVGKLLEGKSPRQADKLRIVDPACGSGSFLIGAYQHLLDWYRDRYLEDGPSKHSKQLFEGPGGAWRLTSAERKRILLNSIYGVDIDAQAVEVTKLSLLLKVLEGETAETIQHELAALRERALPDLGRNIKCGNSLIGPDFYDQQELGDLSEDERLRVNVFDWKAEFPDVFRGKDGGFDAVIGNPPYIPLELLTPSERSYLSHCYDELKRKFDTAAAFVLRGRQLLSPPGLIGFITSVTWQTGENYSSLRQAILSPNTLQLLINLPFDVFAQAYVDTCVFVLGRSSHQNYRFARFPKKTRITTLAGKQLEAIPVTLITPPTFKVVIDQRASVLLQRLVRRSQMTTLGELTASTQGLAGNRFEVRAAPTGKFNFPFLQAGKVQRFALSVEELRYVSLQDTPTLVPYYEAAPKLLIRRVISRQDRILATLFRERMVFKKDINPFLVTSAVTPPEFLVALVNSRLFSYLYVNTSSIAGKDDFRQTTLAELRSMPVPVFDGTLEVHGQLCDAAITILGLTSRLCDGAMSQAMTAAETRRFESLDAKIDRLAYSAYGLTDAEIRIVEEATAEEA